MALAGYIDKYSQDLDTPLKKIIDACLNFRARFAGSCNPLLKTNDSKFHIVVRKDILEPLRSFLVLAWTDIATEIKICTLRVLSAEVTGGAEYRTTQIGRNGYTKVETSRAGSNARCNDLHER